jgi:Trk K+ transport system NAD-binding subunit
VDFIAKPGAKIIGKSISKELPRDSLAGMVLREGSPMMPGSDFKVEVGDRVFVMSMPNVVSKVKKLFVS